MENDEHPPGAVRVNGVMMNSPDFSRIWDCPKNSVLNPNQKCIFW